MRLIEDQIHKMIETNQSFMIKKFDLAGIYHFYKGFNLALALVNIQDPNRKLRENAWRNLLSATISNNLATKSKYLKILKDIISQDTILLNQALSIISTNSSKSSVYENNIWKEGQIGIPIYDIED